MRLLLDTHVFLWYISGDPQLPTASGEAVKDTGNEVYLSVACVWEAVIKHGLGKLPLPAPPAGYLPLQRERHQIAPLSLDEGALPHLAGLPLLHRDPFDRVLIAHALQHDLIVATVDSAFAGYPVSLLSHS
jgi:PIN domain nuclease of toxin-antitoxin system